MIRPGQRCLIVCSSSEHAYAGSECVALRPFGSAVAKGAPNGKVYEASDFWIIDIPGIPPPTFAGQWGAREKWLVPIDGEPDDEMIRDTIRTAFELGVDA